jgi:hypothetical protein
MPSCCCFSFGFSVCCPFSIPYSQDPSRVSSHASLKSTETSGQRSGVTRLPPYQNTCRLLSPPKKGCFWYSKRPTAPATTSSGLTVADTKAFRLFERSTIRVRWLW